MSAEETDKAIVVRSEGYDVRLYHEDRGAVRDYVTVCDPEGKTRRMNGTWRYVGSRDPIPVNPADLPLGPSPEIETWGHVEMLALAQAGRWSDFFEMCPESGNPDGAAGLRACLRQWVEMREELGLPSGLP